MYYVYSDRQVQLAIYLKAQSFQREDDLSFTTKNISSYLSDVVWQKELPSSLSIAVNDILKITSNELYDYLAHQALLKANKESLNEYQDLLKDNND